MEKAEDLTQETFFRLFKSLPQYSGKGFKAYLYTIANHLCIDESRKARCYPLELENDEKWAKECNELIQIEDREEMNYLLKNLSPEQKEAILLRFVEQLGYLEIAKVTGCTMRTAQSRVRNGLKIMRKEQGYER